MRSDYYYQIALIVLGALSAAFLGIFVYREIYPVYLVFQNDYVALEEFHSTYSGQTPSHFSKGVKQILIESPTGGPPVIDRCISCHVALDIPYFSPTKLAYDVNGKIILDEKGIPVQIPNEDYIWGKLDQRITELTDSKINEQLTSQGQLSQVKERLKEAEKLKSLKTTHWGEQVYDVTKALTMHPLMGRETRPFEYHPIATYGCTSCHSGNGYALTVDKAHGPIFDGQYEIEYRGPKPKFLESDPKNDPRFSTVFNDKPGHALIFQTTPILVGDLIQAKCMQCHQTGQQSILGALDRTRSVSGSTEKIIAAISESYENALNSLVSLVKLKISLEQKGINLTIDEIQHRLDTYQVPPEDLKNVQSQLQFLKEEKGAKAEEEKSVNKKSLFKINQQLTQLIGSPELIQQLDDELKIDNPDIQEIVEKFVQKNRLNPQATGRLFSAANSLELEQALFHHVRDTETSFTKAVGDQRVMNAIQTDVDRLTQSYQRGKELYIQQACYACHRIAGFARGGVGPELTQVGKNYPWYIKHHIVWPQGDLPTSSMPNARLDHEELEPLMTYLLGQTGQNDAISKSEYKRALSEWEAGKKEPWEKPITPAQMYDLRYAMTVYATEGCASCHRLKGFESDVGYKIEKDQKTKVSFNDLYKEREWFTKLFPEEILGSQIATALDKHASEIDQHIVDNVRQGSILEEIEKNHPQAIEGFYSNFKFAERAKNHTFKTRADKEKDPEKKKQILSELEGYKKRLHRVLMVYIQEYGLGRLIGPRPNWSGIFRTDAWLMEHFKKPTEHVPRSIMPAFPFDDTKFYALTHMLDVLSKQNRDWMRQLWENNGFNPALAFQIHCSQCHGEHLGGNGPVSFWIYPIPKNLRNAEFLRNYTPARVIDSITHGVKGTPMPPWGEVALDKQINMDKIPVLTKGEIEQLSEWLFSTLPGATIFHRPQDIPKWNYQPQDVIKELKEEKQELRKKDDQQANPLSILMKNLNPFIASIALTPNLFLANATTKNNQEVSEVFDIVPNPAGSVDKNSYYIKRDYYTEENIQAGAAFFNLYCSVCHGLEADGMGPRASVMQEAKPRMLTNLDWLDTHDDLYLLRSIKYGVPGTSMVPWGDQTNSLLRLQLVMYIRSLTEASQQQQKLEEAFYQTFNTIDFLIDTARVNEVKVITHLQKEVQAAQDKQKQLFNEALSNPAMQEEGLKAYQTLLELSEKLNQEKQKDDILVQLKEVVNQEKKIYKDLANSLLASKIEGQIFQLFMQIIENLKGRFNLKDDQLHVQENAATIQTIQALKKKIVLEIDQQIEKLKEQQKQLSPGNEEEVKEIEFRLKTLKDYKNKLEIGFQEAYKLHQKEINLVHKFNAETK